MVLDRRLSYAQVDTWRAYQPFFPEAVRMTERRLPEEEWWRWQDAAVHLDRYRHPGAPATVLLLHGGGGYGRMLCPYALLLQQAGYEVVAPDLPGYGLTDAPEEMFSYQAWVECAAHLVTAEARRGRPVVTFGLSLGGYLAYQAAAKSGRAAGVIATTLADPRLPLVRRQFARNALLGVAGRYLTSVLDAVLGNLRLPIRWLSRMDAIANDPALIALINADPLGGGNRVPVRFLRSVLEMQPVCEPEDFDVCPVLFAQPLADRWTTLEASQPFFDRLRCPKELELLEGCGHLPIEEPGFSRLRDAVHGFLKGLHTPGSERTSFVDVPWSPELQPSWSLRFPDDPTGAGKGNNAVGVPGRLAVVRDE
jgi:alpha-beta hydrolase superfamily lysophospholipase